MTAGRLFDVRVPMADGITLSTDVLLPDTAGLACHPDPHAVLQGQ